MDRDAYDRLLADRQYFFVPLYLEVVDEYPDGISAQDVKGIVFDRVADRYGIDVMDATIVPPNASTGLSQANQWANNLVSNRVLDEFCIVDRSAHHVMLYPYGRDADAGVVGPPIATPVPLEISQTDHFERHGEGGLTPADRSEAVLVARFVEATGIDFVRFRIDIPGEPWPLYTDMYDPQNHTLIEAKSSSRREDIRLAIGQLFDYGRYLDNPALAVLVPEPPQDDMVDLLEMLDIGLVVHPM